METHIICYATRTKKFTKYQNIAEESKTRQKSFLFELLCVEETKKEGRNAVSLGKKEISLGKIIKIFPFFTCIA